MKPKVTREGRDGGKALKRERLFFPRTEMTTRVVRFPGSGRQTRGSPRGLQCFWGPSATPQAESIGARGSGAVVLGAYCQPGGARGSSSWMVDRAICHT